MADGDAYMSYAEVRTKITTDTSLLSDAEADTKMDETDGEINFWTGLDAKTTVTKYISMFKLMEAAELRKRLKNIRIGLEGNPPEMVLEIEGLSEEHVAICKQIRVELDTPAYTRKMMGATGQGERLD